MGEMVSGIVTEEELVAAFGNSDFGDVSKRDVVKNGVLKYGCGFDTGHTLKCILEELRLISNKDKLTSKGRAYLWGAFYGGQSF